MYTLTPEQEDLLKIAAYKIADARAMFTHLNNEMKQNKQWCGQADIATVVTNLEELCETGAGCIGEYLEKL